MNSQQAAKKEARGEKKKLFPHTRTKNFPFFPSTRIRSLWLHSIQWESPTPPTHQICISFCCWLCLIARIHRTDDEDSALYDMWERSSPFAESFHVMLSPHFYSMYRSSSMSVVQANSSTLCFLLKQRINNFQYCKTFLRCCCSFSRPKSFSQSFVSGFVCCVCVFMRLFGSVDHEEQRANICDMKAEKRAR